MWYFSICGSDAVDQSRASRARSPQKASKSTNNNNVCWSCMTLAVLLRCRALLTTTLTTLRDEGSKWWSINVERVILQHYRREKLRLMVGFFKGESKARASVRYLVGGFDHQIWRQKCFPTLIQNQYCTWYAARDNLHFPPRRRRCLNNLFISD